MIAKTTITKREFEVLELISMEYTSDEIARKLYISSHTALSHRKNLLCKMGVRNSAGLVRKAFEYRLLTLSTFLIAFLMVMPGMMIGQDVHLDVEGHLKIRGNIDIHYQEDSTSIHIGKNAGRDSDYIINDFPRGVTFMGVNAGAFNTTGFYNSFFGNEAGLSNWDGDENSFFGYHAGTLNANGSGNSFFGMDCGVSNISGDGNSFFGYQSGYSNIEGGFNSFYGYDSGLENISGWGNAFFGYSSGEKNLSGIQNAFFGYRSGEDLKEGSFNTFIGTEADLDNSVMSDSLDRAIALGYNAKVACHNCAVIGGIGADAVNVGIGTTTPTALLHIEGDANSELKLRDIGNVVNIVMQTSNDLNTQWQMKAESHNIFPVQPLSNASIIFQYGQDSLFRIKGDGNATLAGTLTENSDRRLKSNINGLTGILPQLLLLHGYSYNWKDKAKSQNLQIGLMAQEVKEVFPELIQEDEYGGLSVSYTRFVPLLIEGMREQQLKIDNLEKLVEKLLAKYR